MSTNKVFSIISALFLSTAVCFAQHLDNPVIPRIADCGVLKYNGGYYIGGVSTLGGFYLSDDLMNWSGPVHVFSMDNDWAGPASSDRNIHSNDMRYINGKFELYWSVNYWGQDKTVVHIAHASSDKVLGPYKEPDRTTWLDTRIDPMLFEDIDGSLYLYSVKFTDGNTIWGQKMSDPCTLIEEPVYQLASMPGTWETLDNRVIEGPWVIRYRDKYYMIFNTNHSAPSWGNYMLGVATADSPLSFHNGSKYTYPVMTSNQLPLEDNHMDILRYADSYNPMFKFSFNEGLKGWTESGYDDSGWQEGPGGFGTERVAGSWVRTAASRWEGEHLQARKHFTIAEPSKLNRLALRLMTETPANVWLNGKLIVDNVRGNSIINLPEKASKYLKKGDNVLAFESTRANNRSSWLEVSLFDMGDEIADDILYTPGQPNLVKGPNGLEWWLVYMANKNSEARSQYISRTHFSGDRLYMEPISSTNTRHYVSTPSKPQVFEKFEDGKTELKEGRFIDSQYASSTFYYETMLKTNGTVDFVIGKLDADKALSEGKYFSVRIDSRTEYAYVNEKAYELPDNMDWSYLHQIVVQRNGNRATLTIDGKPVNGCTDILLPNNEAIAPGMVPVNGSSEIGNIIYTIGWDEYGKGINGWEIAEGSSDGGVLKAFKGDPAFNYDYSLKVSAKTKAGAFPVWQDENNYVKVALNPESFNMDITICQKGKSKVSSYPLDKLEAIYHDMRHSDSMHHIYSFSEPVTIDRLLLPKQAQARGKRVEDLFPLLGFEYRCNGKWAPLEFKTSDNSKYCIAEMAPTRIEALRVMNQVGNDLTNYIYRILAHENFKDAYHLHFIREGESLVIRADGEDVTTLDLKGFGKSRVGLCSEGEGNSFDGIVYFQK